MKAYIIKKKDGSYWLRSLSMTRSECVYMWTGGFKSERCKAWLKAKRLGAKIVSVMVEEI